MLRSTLTLLGITVTFACLCRPDIGHAQTYYVGTCHPGKSDYATIQKAVTNVPSGSTINICPGNYPEQVTIQQPLTLKGIQNGGSASVVLSAPGGALNVPGVTTLYPLAAQLQVINSGGPVNISGLTIDGTGLILPTSGTDFFAVSILYDSSPGTLDHVVSQNLQPANANVTGIVVLDDSSVSPTVTIQNSFLTMLSGGHSLTYTGIQASQSAVLTVTNNYLSFFNGVDYSSVGIFTTATGAGKITGNTIDLGDLGSDTLSQGISSNGLGPLTITGNTITNARTGIQLAGSVGATVTGNTLTTHVPLQAIGIFTGGSSATIKGNQIFSSSPFTSTSTGIFLQCGPPAAISGNLIMGASVGLADVPAGTSLAGNAGNFFDVPTVEQVCQSVD